MAKKNKRAGSALIDLEYTLPSVEETKVYELRKQATQQKKTNNFNEAVQLLEEAINISKKYRIPISAKDFIRYANYLQLAERNDHAWSIFNKVVCDYLNIFDQIDTYNAMRLFLQREGRNKLAVQYGVLVRLLEIKKWKEFSITESQNNAKMENENNKRWKEISTHESIENLVMSLLNKADLLDAKNDIIKVTKGFANQTPQVDIVEIFRVIPSILNKYDTL